MKGRIGLFHFSGTGNTEIIAGLLEKELTGIGYAVESGRIEDVLKGKAACNPDDFDMIGIGGPVSAFSAPRIVLAFMRALPKAKGKKMFIFRTAGGVAPQNYHASASMIRRARRKGYDVFYERLFSLGSNWVMRFDDEITRRLYDADVRKVEIMCRELAEGRSRFLEAPLSAKALSAGMALATKLIVPLAAKDYKVGRDCTLCGICVKKCPMGNIRVKRDRIRFGFSCTWCLRCIYACPKRAIAPRLFSFIVIKEGYDPHAILKGREPRKDLSGIMVPRFFDAYVGDDAL